MAITKIKVSNFKSFDELKLDLRPLNIVIGANAAGKSNFLEIFRFLRDIAEHGIENAVSLQGGMDYLGNLQIRDRSTRVAFEAHVPSGDGDTSLSGEVTILPRSGSPGFQIVTKETSSGFPDLLEILSGDIRIFDFDPGLSKRAIPVSGKADLEPDGSNLALILRRVLQDEKDRFIFTELLKDALPFVADLRVEQFTDRSLLLALKENYSWDSYVPAAFLSDGTIHLVALILALYFERGEIIVIEEPERNIHPRLISKVVGMLKDTSRRKQVIVTTHNPELVKHADLADLLLVQRDELGFSRISRPAENEELKVFLENDLGIEDLYVQNLLGLRHAV